MKKALVLAISAVLILGVASQASAAVKITKIYYDSPGTDTGSNSSLNAEYVRIKNTGTRRVTLTGWTLRDASKHVFKFPTFRLAAGKTVTVHTGKGSNGASNLYWGSTAYIWNNTGDTASLKRRDGSLASRCSYPGGGAFKLC
jgi:P pilus assembly chaperone PapD